MVETTQPTSFQLSPDKQRITVAGKEFNVQFDEWNPWHGEGFRWRTYKYEGVDAQISDGAEIEIKDRGRTVVQAFVPKRNGEVEFYWEQPRDGNLTMLHTDENGKVLVEHFDNETLSKRMIVMKPGMLMCWFGGKTKNGVSHVLESEYPGFDENDLQTVQLHEKQIGAIVIPDEFWAQFDILEAKSKKITSDK